MMAHFGIPATQWAQILAIFRKRSTIREVILFGSRAKGNYREGSDIDLAVKGQGITSGLLAQIDEEYDALDLPWKLDVLDYAKIHDAAVKAHIDRVGIAVLQR